MYIIYFLIPKYVIIRRKPIIINFLSQNIQSFIIIQSQDKIYIRRVIFFNYYVFKAKNIIIFLIITIIIIFLNIICRIYNWINLHYSFQHKCLLLPTLGTAKTNNLEIEITILFIFLNISCRINITWYIYIIAFGTSVFLVLLEIGTIKLGYFYFSTLLLYFSWYFSKVRRTWNFI